METSEARALELVSRNVFSCTQVSNLVRSIGCYGSCMSNCIGLTLKIDRSCT